MLVRVISVLVRELAGKIGVFGLDTPIVEFDAVLLSAELGNRLGVPKLRYVRCLSPQRLHVPALLQTRV